MYIPPKYQNHDAEALREFIKVNSFGILINMVNGKPWATHIPLVLDTDAQGQDVLTGHIAKANPQWKHFSKEQQVLCIFNGPHAYISPAWYSIDEVPTWNYIAVHVYGRLEMMDEADTLRAMQAMVAKYESSMKNPLSLSDFSAKSLKQVRAVVGFRIIIDTIEGAAKLSQGMEQDHDTIINGLEQGSPSDRELAARMKGKKS